MLKKALLLCMTFIALSGLLHAEDPQFIYVAATHVRIRATPNTSAAVVAVLPIGTWVKPLEKSGQKQSLLGKNDYWYKIAVENNKQGWIFGGLALAASEEERFSKAIELLKSRLEMSEKPLEENIQVYEFATTVKDLASHSAEKARLELAFLQSIDKVCESMMQAGLNGEAKQKDNKAITENKSIVYYHECAGQYFVEPKAYWDLAEKYSDIPAEADEIAWAASGQAIQGESEGDPSALCARFELAAGSYIEKYPSGKHLNEAFNKGKEIFDFIAESINNEYFGAEGAEDKKTFIASLDKFEASAAKTPDSTERKAYLKAISEVRSKLSN